MPWVGLQYVVVECFQVLGKGCLLLIYDERSGSQQKSYIVGDGRHSIGMLLHPKGLAQLFKRPMRQYNCWPECICHQNLGAVPILRCCIQPVLDVFFLCHNPNLQKSGGSFEKPPPLLMNFQRSRRDASTGERQMKHDVLTTPAACFTYEWRGSPSPPGTLLSWPRRRWGARGSCGPRPRRRRGIPWRSRLRR